MEQPKTDESPLAQRPPFSAVLEAVAGERVRQDSKWGGPETDDVRKTEQDWCDDIEAYVAWARQMHRCGSPEKYRRRMMQVAALAVAACESFDRKAANTVELTGLPLAASPATGGSDVE